MDIGIDLNKKHPTHITRESDSSSYYEVCTVCGATNVSGDGWGKLAIPCPGQSNKDFMKIESAYKIKQDNINKTVGIVYRDEFNRRCTMFVTAGTVPAAHILIELINKTIIK